MKIIYKYQATDEDVHGTSLSSQCVNHTLYPSLFVADNSKFDLWESSEI
jgi:hypothetical protein|tara:strand:- start:1501 stop:1647 length:147 start_codon:yes stop_codon:yes gene_type:complete